MKFNLLTLALLLLLSACGGSSSPTTEKGSDDKITEPPVLSANLAIPNNRDLGEYQLLIIGNSHVQYTQELLTIIFENGLKDKNIGIDTRIGAFLDVIVDNESLIELIATRPWTHIVLQGQKYSQSQSVEYSTEAAITWIQRAKNIGATPILYPEHPQRGNPQEADYVHGIHLGIAEEESSCVAPIGLSWNKVIAIEPSLDLYQADGNHATELGSLLSALVLYQVISGQNADMLPYIEELPGAESTQALLGQMASQTIAEKADCKF